MLFIFLFQEAQSKTPDMKLFRILLGYFEKLCVSILHCLREHEGFTLLEVAIGIVWFWFRLCWIVQLNSIDFNQNGSSF